jgi:hypothetical protein
MDDWEYQMGPADWPLELPDGRIVRMGDATDEEKAAAAALLVQRAREGVKNARAGRRGKRDFRAWLREQSSGGG